MIQRLSVTNYKALRDVSIDLTPIHVLIGPNDSGKTSVLESLLALCRSVEVPLASAFTGAWSGAALVWKYDPTLPVTFTAALGAAGDAPSYEYSLACRFAANDRKVVIESETVARVPGTHTQLPSKNYDRSGVNLSQDPGHASYAGSDPAATRAIFQQLAGVEYFRWNARMLALPVAPDSRYRFRMESSGFGLARCLDDILGYDRDRFAALEARFKRVFPAVKSIKLISEMAFRSPSDDATQVPQLQRADGKGIYFEMAYGGRPIPAAQASDGLLLVLAYLAVLYLPEPPRVLLVEEPENGIHPKRLEDVLKILRELVGEQGHTQVVMTTHSPYVVDLFRPEEVTLCRKEQDGSVSVHRLSESGTIRQQLDVFSLGEIWTAEGDDALAGVAPSPTRDHGGAQP